MRASSPRLFARLGFSGYSHNEGVTHLFKTHLPRVLPVIVLVGGWTAISVAGDDAADGPFRQIESGKIKLQKGFLNAHNVTLGKRLKGTAKLHLTDFFGAKAISGQVDIENPTKAEVNMAYHLAFFNDQGEMLGCASQAMAFPAGEKTSLGSAIIHLPNRELEKITSFRIVYYEDDRRVGKR